jgi:hypothetical protein
LRIRNVLEVMTDTATWEEIVERVTGILEKEKIHTGVKQPGQSSSSSVNQVLKKGGDEIGRLTKQVHTLTKEVRHEKQIRKQGGGGQSDNIHEELMRQGICFFWMKGRCSKGNDCKFKHQKPVKRKASPIRSPSVTSVGSVSSKSSGGSVSSADSRVTKKGEITKKK